MYSIDAFWFVDYPYRQSTVITGWTHSLEAFLEI